MNRDERLADLIDRWEELRREGKSPSAAELARESPELIGPLREWIAAFDLADRIEEQTDTLPTRRRRIDAEHVSLEDFSNTILAHGLVSVTDLDRTLARLQRRCASPTAKELSSALIRRGLLTAEQGQVLLAGGGGELIVGDFVILDPAERREKCRFLARRRSDGERVVLERAFKTPSDSPDEGKWVSTKGASYRVTKCSEATAVVERGATSGPTSPPDESIDGDRVSAHPAQVTNQLPANDGGIRWPVVAISIGLLAILAAAIGWVMLLRPS